MKVTCQYTGIEFEAASARTKNHPEFARLMTEANRRGIYICGNFLTAIAEARKNGEITIEFCRSELERIDKKLKDAEAAFFKKRDEALAAKKAALAAQNAHLRTHGYKWVHFTEDEDDGVCSVCSGRWHLRAPSGDLIPVAQALDEIERGADVVRAEIAAARAVRLLRGEVMEPRVGRKKTKVTISVEEYEKLKEAAK